MPSPKENQDELIKDLGLQPHPDGGYYKETDRSSTTVHPDDQRYNGESRSAFTSINYLLGVGESCSFHRLKSDETWRHTSGSPLKIYILQEDKTLKTVRLDSPTNGNPGTVSQYTVENGLWYAAEPEKPTKYSLVTCTVSPGFIFADWEQAKANDLVEQYSQHEAIIRRLTRDTILTSEEKTERDQLQAPAAAAPLVPAATAAPLVPAAAAPLVPAAAAPLVPAAAALAEAMALAKTNALAQTLTEALRDTLTEALAKIPAAAPPAADTTKKKPAFFHNGTKTPERPPKLEPYNQQNTGTDSQRALFKIKNTP